MFGSQASSTIRVSEGPGFPSGIVGSGCVQEKKAKAIVTNAKLSGMNCFYFILKNT